MSFYITIDGGTTNTRISLVKNKVIIDKIKLNIGARDGIENKNLLKIEIKSAIQKILKDNSLTENEVSRILASGMITSEFGLCGLEHISTPAGIEELHNSMYEVTLDEISDIPFVFIRGVKTSSDRFEDIDVMRGEETEIMGILSTDYGDCIYVLPGSHSKIIKMDNNNRIADFSTMLTGEMISSMSQHTILKDAVDLNTCVINDEYLLKGYDYCMREGINKALFKTRILNNFLSCSKEEIYSFFIGAILCGEVEQIIKSKADIVVIGGKSQLKNAISAILNKRGSKTIISLEECIVDCSTALGAVRIFENCN